MDKKNIVVVVSSDTMGKGDENLGKRLLKAFFFSLTQEENLPKTILFYNKGALLTAENSDVLEDLKTLERENVEILVCGTCVKYYGLEEKLCVGSITNMSTIVKKQMEADIILCP